MKPNIQEGKMYVNYHITSRFLFEDLSVSKHVLQLDGILQVNSLANLNETILSTQLIQPLKTEWQANTCVE